MNSLNVAHNGIGDAGNQMITFLLKTNVVRLNIGYTRIGDSQFAAFLRGLEGNRTGEWGIVININLYRYTICRLDSRTRYLWQSIVNTITPGYIQEHS